MAVKQEECGGAQDVILGFDRSVGTCLGGTLK